MADAHKNFAYSTVATAPSPAASGTSLVVAAGHGARFPAVPFNATVWPVGAIPTPTNAEIVRVTARDTDTLTITRAQESSSARTVLVGDQIAATVTAKTMTDAERGLRRRVYVPAFSCKSPSTAGAADGTVEGTDASYRVKDFDATDGESIDIELPIPDEYDGGNITWTIWWTAASGSGGVVFILRTEQGGDNSVIDATPTTRVTVIDTLQTAGNRHKASGAWSTGKPVAGDMIQVRIDRLTVHGSDTLAVDARLIGFSLDFGVS